MTATMKVNVKVNVKAKTKKENDIYEAMVEELNRLIAKNAVKIRGLRKNIVKDLIAQSRELNAAYRMVRSRKFPKRFFHEWARNTLGFTKGYTIALLAIYDLWVGKAIEDVAPYFDTVAMLNIAKMKPLDALAARNSYLEMVRDHIATVKGCYVSGKVVLWPTFRYSEWFKNHTAMLKATAEASKPKYQWLTVTHPDYPGDSLQIKSLQKGKKKKTEKQMKELAAKILNG